MFTPHYTLSPKLLENLTTIERVYGQIEALRLPKELEINLERKNLIQSSYASNRIEGNPLTLPEVTNLLLDDRIPVNRDEKEVVNYFDILKHLASFEDRQLSVELVTEFHKALMTGVDETAGHIRNVQVVVGKYKKSEQGEVSLTVKHNPPAHSREKIELLLGDLFTWTNSRKDTPAVILTGLFHHNFVYIHPFEDGNGRVCRILTALLFLKKGYAINKYFVLDDYYDIDRHQYSDMLHSADSGDGTQWLEYYSDGVRYSLEGALAKAKDSLETLDIKRRPTPKEALVWEYLKSHPQVRTQELVTELGVTRQQAHNLLSSLVKKGLVDKKGSTKSSYYFLK
jgi:Fic family protein